MAVLQLEGRTDAVAGAAAMAPFVIAYIPFAVVIGSTAATVDQPFAGWAGSWLIYGGSAHLAALQSLAAGSVVLAIVTGLLVQARLLVYGAGVAPLWRDQPTWFRALAPAFLVDPTWALAARHAATDPTPGEQRRFFLGAGVTLGIGWSGAMAVGVLMGARIPHVGFDLAAPLCLIALVGPRLRDRGHRVAAVSAALTFVPASGWPFGSGVLAAIVAGAVAAHFAGDRTEAGA